QGSEDGQDNTDDEPDALMTASTQILKSTIIKILEISKMIVTYKTSDLPLISQKKNNLLSNLVQGTIILENGQDNTNGSVLEPDALTTTSSALHANNGQENTSTLNIKNLRDNVQSTVILEDGQDNTNGSVLEPDALTTASSADIGQENASTLKKNKAKK
ncbi:19966_t:CDS:2, partial [Gigaspora margarita]